MAWIKLLDIELGIEAELLPETWHQHIHELLTGRPKRIQQPRSGNSHVEAPSRTELPFQAAQQWLRETRVPVRQLPQSTNGLHLGILVPVTKAMEQELNRSIWLLLCLHGVLDERKLGVLLQEP